MKDFEISSTSEIPQYLTDEILDVLAQSSACVESVTVSIAGHPIRIESDSNDFFNALRFSCRHLFTAASPTSNGWRFIVRTSKQRGMQSGANRMFRPAVPGNASNSGDSLDEIILYGQAETLYFSRQRRLGIMIIPAGALPVSQIAAPLRLLIHLYARCHGLQLIHAAAVGHANGAVLLVGQSGAGKSTTTLAAFSLGMQVAGDDYVIAQTSPTPTVWSVYSSTKICDEARSQFPEIRQTEISLDSEGLRYEEKRKFVFNLASSESVEMLPNARIRAVIVSAVTPGEPENLVPSSPAAALRALAPSTLFQLPFPGHSDLSRLGELVRGLPCYRLSGGGSPLERAKLIQKLIS